jgi:hypothetical protein
LHKQKLGTGSQIAIKRAPYSLNELYDKFAGMLLGYIIDIVNDAKLAEQHLVSIFNSLPSHLNEINADGCNAWCHLQRLAQRQLAGFCDDNAKTNQPENIDLSGYYNRNKFLGFMSEEQRLVFCYVYYKGRTTAQLAMELNKPEASIRKLLKEAFGVIKKGS